MSTAAVAVFDPASAPGLDTDKVACRCPHLPSAGDLPSTSAAAAASAPSNTDRDTTCSSCAISDDIWICLACGVRSCGRYSGAHALQHFKETRHPVCFDVSTRQLFCYQCDDTVTEAISPSRLALLVRGFVGGVEAQQLDRRKRGRRPRAGSTTNADGDPLACTRGQVGLANLGNSCFLSSVLQALSHTTLFRREFLEQQLCPPSPAAAAAASSSSAPPPSMSTELSRLFRLMWRDQSPGAISPTTLFQTLRLCYPIFNGFRQHDAHECLRLLLDRLSAEHEVASNMFGGLLHSEVTCTRCGTVFRKHEPYQDLSLEIAPHSVFLRRAAAAPGAGWRTRQHDIRDCLKRFCAPERLAAPYQCPTCLQRTEAVKRLRLHSSPEVLCLHLKRFKWTTRLHAKVSTRIAFPLESLDVGAFCVEPTARGALYDLTGIIRHHGGGLAFGHYTTYGLNSETGAWLHFDDLHVSRVTPEEVEQVQPYILFYSKRKPPSP